MKNNEFQELVDQNLSGLVWDERKRLRVLYAVSEEVKPVKKISTTFILIAAILCISVTALAAGLVFSNRVDATKMAEKALTDTYGITDSMLSTFFSRSIEEQSDGSMRITYAESNDLHYVLGEYTILVKDGKASASWNHEGEDTTGLFEADAWGKEQLEEMMYLAKRDHEIIAFNDMAKSIAKKYGDMPHGAGSDKATTVREGAEEAKAAAKASKFTEEDLIVKACDAAISAYDLNREQADLLKPVFELEDMADSREDYMYYHMQEGKPIFTIMLDLHQQKSDDPDHFPAYSEKDGVYWVDVNVETGVIENIRYDTQLGGNG